MARSIPVAALAALIVLAGCNGYERLPKQELDESFTLDGIDWSKGANTIVMLKAFKSDSNLAVCGAYSGTANGDVHAQLTRQFFDRASIVIGDETIGSMSFVNMVSESDLKIEKLFERYVVVGASAPANCIRTKRPWKEDYRRKPIDFKGPKTVRGRF